eukprot:scaffold253034_cov18-Tisochrysis_lutea.AAC.3
MACIGQAQGQGSMIIKEPSMHNATILNSERSRGTWAHIHAHPSEYSCPPAVEPTAAKGYLLPRLLVCSGGFALAETLWCL